MKIWVLAKRENFGLYNFARFPEEADKESIDIELVAPEDFDIIIHKEGRKSIHYLGNYATLPDCFIPRMGSGSTYFGLAVTRHLENQGILVLNTAASIDLAKDKLASLQILLNNNIPTPKTMLAKFPVDIETIEKEFQYPIVMKVVSGSFGKGVFMCESREKLQDAMDLMEASKNPNVNIILQEFVSSSQGRDIRVIVIGGRAIGAMLRKSQDGSFKANFSKGGTVEPFPLNPAVEWLAVESTRVLGLEIAGVDLLFDGDNYKVCEVNSAPGFEGFEKATGINIPKEIFEYIKVRLAQKG